MSGLKREDEYRLKELTQLAEEKGRCNLTEDQMLLLLLLEDRYNKFLDEGLRKLREAASPQSPRASFRGLFSGRGSPKPSQSGNPSEALGDSVSLLSGDSASGAASPMVPPPQAEGKHWTWIFDQVVVGAVPFASQTTDTPGHLCELNEQCYQRKSRIAAVVSCLDVEEPIPTGFAVAKDWEVQLGVNTFFHVACIPSGTGDDGPEASAPTTSLADQILLELSPGGPKQCAEDSKTAASESGVDGQSSSGEEATPLPANPSFEEIITVCQNIAKIIDQEPDSAAARKKAEGIKHRLSIVGQKAERRKVVYVHCKAGLARSWVFAMCYILHQHHRSFEEADVYLKTLRPFCPKPCHVAFVQGFHAYINSPRFAAHSNDEETYIRLLAEVLSMAPKYRLKLLQDLEKLT